MSDAEELDALRVRVREVVSILSDIHECLDTVGVALDGTRKAIKLLRLDAPEVVDPWDLLRRIRSCTTALALEDNGNVVVYKISREDSDKLARSLAAHREGKP